MPTRRHVLLAGLGAAALGPEALTFPGATVEADPWPQDAARPNLTWHEVTPAHTSGQGWTDTVRPFDRLPARAEGVVPAPVWGLAQDSAGLSVEFVADAPSLHLAYRLNSSDLAMPHMPATGVSGFDLYGRDGARWRWAATVQPRAQEAEVKVIDGLTSDVSHERRWRMHFPLYNGVAALKIGVPEGAYLELLPKRTGRPVVFYGTSILQGACASRPGMAWSTIVGRRLDVPVINLGFSGNGKMELALAELLGELDAAVYVLDCAPNMNAKLISERAAPFVRRLRELRPATPIVLVEDRRYGYAWVQPRAEERNAASAAALRATYTELRAEGVAGLAYVEADKLLGSEAEDTLVDGSHPSDLGMVRYADALTPVVAALLA